ncbi:hypothetical protein [Plantactinospora sp. KLBMP9567]|uniref:hypothetical protein n=1 Tax=Plantactinospora sp. KLBMP9567 TaxID=3085900 RepID=UPI002980DDAE|nr:hypothetical protein [Plantactinospora sp. KLBMP9567]MDW5328379.1 hypothetical protein [Plantactinospora sp. KLBMP9567]
MTGLERRYRWLLRAYPRAYRQYRADEMLETLLAAGETDRRHPNLRESLALLMGGLRARSGVDQLGSRVALRYSALRLTALSLLVCGIALTALPVVWRLWLLLPGSSSTALVTGSLVTPAIWLLALAAAAWARYRLALAITIIAFIADHWHSVAHNQLYVEQWTGGEVSGSRLQAVLHLAVDFPTWACVLAALTMLPLLSTRQPQVRRPWIWLVVAATVVVIMTPNPLNGWAGGFGQTVIVAAWLMAAIVGAAFDVRICVVASALLLVPILGVLAYELMGWMRDGWGIGNQTLLLAAMVGMLAVTLTVSRTATRRQIAL